MCLRIQSKFYLQDKKSLKTKNIFYKVVRLNHYNVSSLNQNHLWAIGCNHSSRGSALLTGQEETYGEVNHGIHVFRTLKEAQIVAGDSFKIMKVECLKKDFVASSRNQLVFTKVVLTQAEFLKIIGV